MYILLHCIIFFIIILSILVDGNLFKRRNDKQVLVISLDAYGHQYLQKYPVPNMKKLFFAGVHPKFFRNQFPTKTFPNHFSMATGLYIESHGVVDNIVYDKTLDKKLGILNPEMFQQNKKIEPVWILNEQHGGVSACLMWPGCGFVYQNTVETYNLPFTRNLTFKDTIEASLALLFPSKHPSALQDIKSMLSSIENNTSVGHFLSNNGDGDSANVWDVMRYSNKVSSDNVPPANLVMMYYYGADDVGHLHGPNSPQMAQMLQHIDDGLGYLQQQLLHHSLHDKLDIVVTSDHGMLEIYSDHVLDLDLDSLVDKSVISGSSPLLHIHPKLENTLWLYDYFRNLESVNNFTLIIKEKLPDHLHFKNNARLPQMLLQADPGYVFEDFQYFLDKRHDDNASLPYGDHGYDVDLVPEMAPILVAVGPSFRKNTEVPAVSNVDMYPLLCSLLHLPPAPNNGSLEPIELMLRVAPLLDGLYLSIIVFGVLGCAVVLGLLLYCSYCRSPSAAHKRLRTDSEALITGFSYRRPEGTSTTTASASRTSAIMLSEVELEEEEKLLSRVDAWEV